MCPGLVLIALCRSTESSQEVRCNNRTYRHTCSHLQERHRALCSAVIRLKIASCSDSSGMRAEQSLWSAMETTAHHHFREGNRTPEFRVAETALAMQCSRGTTFPHIILALLLPVVSLLSQPQLRAKMKITSLAFHFRTRTLLWLNLHSSHAAASHCAVL